MARFANWRSPERVKARLQAQLYHARKRRRERLVVPTEQNSFSYGNETVQGSSIVSIGSKTVQMVCIGDSRMEGDFAGQTAFEIFNSVGEWVWVDFSDSPVTYNFSEGGSTIDEAITQAASAVLTGAKIFNIITGTNGAGGGLPDTSANRISKTLDLLAELDVADARIFLSNEIPGDFSLGTSGTVKFEHHEWLNSLTTAAAGLSNAQLFIVNTWDAVADPSTTGADTVILEDFRNDGLHPSNKGQELLSKAFWEAYDQAFSNPYLDLQSPSQNLLDGTSTTSLTEGDIPSTISRIGGAVSGISYSTENTGLDTILTITNNNSSSTNISLRANSAATTSAFLMMETYLEPDSEADPLLSRDSDQELSIRNFDFGTGISISNKIIGSHDVSLTSQKRVQGGYRRMCVLLGNSTGTGQIQLRYEIGPNETLQLRRLQLHQ